ncbi:AraC family transcriptional regulator [Melioribacteraceae bacterium 4301-Me]|uniref:AraC family transcriptional regulator n=1 Tax=Pyranulibacter aquaticus TaxID=3163344 RepID=UPI00359581B8
MKKNVLYIRNMVCNRCIKVIKEEFEKLNINIVSISLGEVETEQSIDNLPIEKIKKVLRENGFELIEDRKARIIEKVKKVVIDSIYNDKLIQNSNINFSKLIEDEIGLDYNYISRLFSSLESITIEQYTLLQKIERAKELLKYGELTLSEIAYKLGYSSVQHLSNQFKKITGLTASQFKNLTINIRRPIDQVK